MSTFYGTQLSRWNPNDQTQSLHRSNSNRYLSTVIRNGMQYPFTNSDMPEHAIRAKSITTHFFTTATSKALSFLKNTFILSISFEVSCIAFISFSEAKGTKKYEIHYEVFLNPTR